MRITYYNAAGTWISSDQSAAGFAIIPDEETQHTTADLDSWDGHSLACQLDTAKLTVSASDLSIASLGPPQRSRCAATFQARPPAASRRGGASGSSRSWSSIWEPTQPLSPMSMRLRAATPSPRRCDQCLAAAERLFRASHSERRRHLEAPLRRPALPHLRERRPADCRDRRARALDDLHVDIESGHDRGRERAADPGRPGWHRQGDRRDVRHRGRHAHRHLLRQRQRLARDLQRRRHRHEWYCAHHRLRLLRQPARPDRAAGLARGRQERCSALVLQRRPADRRRLPRQVRPTPPTRS